MPILTSINGSEKANTDAKAVPRKMKGMVQYEDDRKRQTQLDINYGGFRVGVIFGDGYLDLVLAELPSRNCGI